MKLAGGDIISSGKPETVFTLGGDSSEKRLLRRLMPGYALIERRDLLSSPETGKDCLERILDALKIHTVVTLDGEDKVTHVSTKRYDGWIVPIAAGFKTIAPVGKVKNTRDSNYDHAFVENILTLGEFKMPYRFDSVDEIMWHYEYRQDQGLYLCVNKKEEDLSWQAIRRG